MKSIRAKLDEQLTELSVSSFFVLIEDRKESNRNQVNRNRNHTVDFSFKIGIS